MQECYLQNITNINIGMLVSHNNKNIKNFFYIFILKYFSFHLKYSLNRIAAYL